MYLQPYYSLIDNNICISAEQASRFAKEVAGDFNPIHDTDARRFCVPGDLLFALILQHYGLFASMRFTFTDMLGADVPLVFPDTDADTFEITDTRGNSYLRVECAGPRCTDATLVETFTRRYVAFSGHNFPHLLQPLMAERGVMFNPRRPLVIYDSMSFALQRSDMPVSALALTDSSLDIAGKRGDVLLHFAINADNALLGTGSKKLIISGLREYDDSLMQEIVAEFYRRKQLSRRTSDQGNF